MPTTWGQPEDSLDFRPFPGLNKRGTPFLGCSTPKLCRDSDPCLNQLVYQGKFSPRQRFDAYSAGSAEAKTSLTLIVPPSGRFSVC
jgi:hypothetical protein